jgi:signal transduction histidine kinase
MTELEPTASTASLRLENERLRGELSALLAELRACRARAIEATETARRRIERDLHDGIQQRLVSLALSLGLLDAKLPTEPDTAKPILREAREALTVALHELRELSQGLCPGIIVERGLAAALEELRGRSSLTTRLDVVLNRRPPAEVEACAYFLVSEALTNVAKHAHADQVLIMASYVGQLLVIEVADDGDGGATTHGGTGLRGLVERVEALGGRLIVSSPPRRGTILRAEIPSRSGSGGGCPPLSVRATASATGSAPTPFPAPGAGSTFWPPATAVLRNRSHPRTATRLASRGRVTNEAWT